MYVNLIVKQNNKYSHKKRSEIDVETFGVCFLIYRVFCNSYYFSEKYIMVNYPVNKR